MERFNIYCTPEQTERAWRLGAPITAVGVEGIVKVTGRRCVINGWVYKIPTREQMFGWLAMTDIVIKMTRQAYYDAENGDERAINDALTYLEADGKENRTHGC